MLKSKEKIKVEIANLIKGGEKILSNELKHREDRKSDSPLPSIPNEYQVWYTLTLPIVKQLAPERYEEFLLQYQGAPRKEINALTYTISDYLLGLNNEELFDGFQIFFAKLYRQVSILKSAEARIDYRLGDIKGIIEAELFDDELEAATELLLKSFLRPAGVLAGVTLERYLRSMVLNHGLKLEKKDPGIADYNDTLKKEGVLELLDWRFIQRLADIRNLCGHDKGREPRKEEVKELIEGVDKVIKSIY